MVQDQSGEVTCEINRNHWSEASRVEIEDCWQEVMWTEESSIVPEESDQRD